MVTNRKRPSPVEQADEVILWMADRTPIFGHLIKIGWKDIPGIVDAKNYAAIFTYLTRAGLVEIPPVNSVWEKENLARLTLQGFRRYEELTREARDSRKAFMAMAFGSERTQRAFADCFYPAVKATGFRLVKLDDQPKAGLIDDRIAVEIRTSRFVVADLSDGNQGAYWEAGFAEGLGRPVFYLCEECKFSEIHFDANHRHIVKWSLKTREKAQADLKATIRNTLPDEAKMED